MKEQGKNKFIEKNYSGALVKFEMVNIFDNINYLDNFKLFLVI